MTIISSQNCINIFHVIGLKYGACSSSLREKLFINEHEIQDFSRSLNSFKLSRVFPDTLYHDGSDSESLRSVAFL